VSAFDPDRILRALAEHEVDFVIIGLLAAWLQGSPAATVDVDVMPRRDIDNADRLATALNSLNARAPRAEGGHALDGAAFLGWRSQRFETDAGPVDVVPVATGIGGYEDVAAVELDTGGYNVRVLSLDQVITSKEALGRPKDLAALPALHAAREALRERRAD
jgi:hypothetical protein